ncbi:protein unc-93 homolog A-like [Lineus longissimus]|uniref:protein unc-93 homolog A-like n=1 Tax=Lineus longissimus TaxID=88925 RepID=UPI002B4CFEC8
MDPNSRNNNADTSVEWQEADDHIDQLHSGEAVRSENDIGMDLLSGHEASDKNEIGGLSADLAENVGHETQHLVPNGTLQVSGVRGSSLSVAASVTKSISFCELNLKPEINPYPVHPVPGRQKMSRKKQVTLMKDLFVVSIAFMLLYSGFNGIQNIASSLFQDKGLGVLSYSCYYACGITSCFLTPIILKKLTPKWTLVLSHILTCLFLGSLLYPRTYTLIPSSLLLGITNGPLWAAAALYVSAAGFEYAGQTGKTVAPVISRFHGIWISFQQVSQIFGNLLSSLVFQLGEMAKPESYYGRVCGAEQCPVFGTSTNSNTSSIRRTGSTLPRNMSNSQNYTLFEFTKNKLNNSYDHSSHDTEHLNKIYILGGVYISLVVVAIILLIALLRVFRASSAVHDFGSTVSMMSVMSDQQSIGNLLLSSFRLLKKPKMLLLLPMSYLTGMHQGYLYADFTQAYISCTIGVSWVGYAMICYGITDVIFCYVGGKLNRLVGRVALYTGAFTVQSALVLTLILWSPSPDSLAPFFIIPALWGMCDAVWQPQTTALLSTLFPHRQEASFTNFRLLHCLGFAITFGYSQALCISVKFYIFQAIMTFAFICYIILEMRLRKSKCLFTNGNVAGKTIVINGVKPGENRRN